MLRLGLRSAATGPSSSVGALSLVSIVHSSGLHRTNERAPWLWVDVAHFRSIDRSIDRSAENPVCALAEDEMLDTVSYVLYFRVRRDWSLGGVSS